LSLYINFRLIILLMTVVTASHAFANKKNNKEKLHIVLLADEKDHGPAGNGLHDYPLWQERAQRLLNKKGRFAKVSKAWNWPSAEQFKTADVIVAYCFIKWTDKRFKQIKRYLRRGGGLVLIHAANWTKPKPTAKVAKMLGVGGFELFRFGTVKLDVVAQEHPICAGLPTTIVLEDDEMYWPPTPKMGNVTVLATSIEEKGTRGSTPKAAHPALWCYESGKGRVFGCVPGHNIHTFNNLAFRKILLQGIKWAAAKP